MLHTKSDLEHLKLLIEAKRPNYQDAKVQSLHIDNFLGFQINQIEESLIKNKNIDQEFWVGLDVQIMQTPYSEILEMMRHLNLNHGQSVIDLGAAYGRMGIVIGLLYPEIQFVGYEYVKERVIAGNAIYNKWNFNNSKLYEADLADENHQIPNADMFFIYDFGSKKDVYSVLEKLRLKAQQQSIKVIARGGGIRNWIMQDFPWLSQFNNFDRFDHWTLFRS